MAIEKMTSNNFKITFGNVYSLDYDCDYIYDCKSSGCDSICRCGRITNLKMKTVNPDISWLKIYNRKIKLSEIDRYCFDRLLRIYKTYDENLYTLEISGGYYGEEVTGFEFENAKALLSSVKKILEMKKDIKKIKYVLFKEYSYLLEELKESTTIEKISIPLDRIIVNREYLNRLKKDSQTNIKYKFETNLPIGIVRKLNTNEFKLIDGYHRYLSTLTAEVESENFYCVS